MNTLQAKKLERNPGGSSWAIRRKIIIYTLIFCAGIVMYITYRGTDSRTYETVAQSAFYLAGAIIGSYCFAATWEDKSKIDNLNINTGPITDINPGTITNIDNPDGPKK